MEVTEWVEEVEAMSRYRLAGLAESQAGDKHATEFLESVRDALVESMVWEADHGVTDDPHASVETVADRLDYDGRLHEVSDSAVPVYTSDLWDVFHGLRADQEDVSEFGPVEDLLKGARVAVWMVADRLVRALVAVGMEG